MPQTRFHPASFAALALLLAATTPLGAAADSEPPVRYDYPPLRDLDPAREPALGLNEPMYFIVGGDGDDTSARFQFSFRYRIFDEESALVRTLPGAEHLHFAYTQSSLWNLSEESAPFHDTSYRPSLFWQRGQLTPGWRPGVVRLGYEHESNGQDGAESRSIHTLFAQPAWYVPLAGRELVVVPRLLYYLDKDENPNIRDYRGYGDLVLRFGREHSWVAHSVLRLGTAGRGSVKLDLSYPIRAPIFARAGGFLYLQAFHGYGETLLDYDQKDDLQVRVGLAIVR